MLTNQALNYHLMPIKHIYWFAYFNTDEPSVRYRGKYPLEKLKEEYNISYDLVIPGYRPKAVYVFIKACFSILFNRKQESVIVFEKIHTQRVYGTALKILLKFQPDRTVYDIDDADYLKFPSKNILHFIKNTSQCAVGSIALAKFAAELNNNVFLLTSPVINHKHIKRERNELLTIGWIGYYNAHRESLLQLFFPSLIHVPFPVKLILMGVTKPEHFEEVKLFFDPVGNVTLEIPELINWHDENAIYKKIATFDIGVAPLIDTEINRAKSAFKIKQYLSCGVPVLGSGLGENAAFLKHGINGYVCDNSDNYTCFIQKIAEMSPQEYSMLSYNAIQSIPAFSMDNYCKILLQHLA